jgi:hypothetical protein
MLYHLSLQITGLVCGILLVAYSGFALLTDNTARSVVARLPRHQLAGAVLLTLDLIWCFWLLATMEMGEFATFRKPLLIALPIGYFLVLKFVNEFLAVRALGIFCLLAAEPLLDAAFFRYEPARLLVTVFAYVLIVAGLFWVAAPYLLRDQISWSTRTPARWRIVHGVTLLYGAALLACALVTY